jgi:hypothetical protein
MSRIEELERERENLHLEQLKLQKQSKKFAKFGNLKFPTKSEN